MTTVGRYQGAMMTITKTRGPLRFRRAGQEITFASGSVKTVEVYESVDRFNGINPPKFWKAEVNGVVVYKGTEKGARQQYERALKYLR